MSKGQSEQSVEKEDIGVVAYIVLIRGKWKCRRTHCRFFERLIPALALSTRTLVLVSSWSD